MTQVNSSVQVRSRLVDVLRRDLIGPAHDAEVFSPSPARWYLTGFLVPTSTPEESVTHERRRDDEADRRAENACLVEVRDGGAEDSR